MKRIRIFIKKMELLSLAILFLLDMKVFLNFQKFSEWSQKTFGLTCFWWAKFFAKISFISITLDYIMDFVSIQSAFTLTLDVFMEVFLFYIFVGTVKTCDKLDEKYRNGHKYVNERLLSWVPNRCTYLFFVPLMIVPLLFLGVLENNMYFVFTMLPFVVAISAIIPTLYFMSCTPLPPGESKVKTWLKNAKKKLSEAFVPEPELAPSVC
ncbi:MAG: hypothetical protein ABFQ53_03315 [Patescibacteria group bacterium]